MKLPGRELREMAARVRRREQGINTQADRVYWDELRGSLLFQLLGANHGSDRHSLDADEDVDRAQNVDTVPLVSF